MSLDNELSQIEAIVIGCEKELKHESFNANAIANRLRGIADPAAKTAKSNELIGWLTGKSENINIERLLELKDQYPNDSRIGKLGRRAVDCCAALQDIVVSITQEAGSSSDETAEAKNQAAALKDVLAHIRTLFSDSPPAPAQAASPPPATEEKPLDNKTASAVKKRAMPLDVAPSQNEAAAGEIAAKRRAMPPAAVDNAPPQNETAAGKNRDAPKRGSGKKILFVIAFAVAALCAAAVIAYMNMPTHADHFKTGQTHLEAENYGEAVKYFSKAIKSKPMAEYFYARGGALDLSGDYNGALADYSEAIRLNPNEASYYFDRGNVYNAQKDYSRAINDFAAAIRLDPNDSRYRNHRGNMYRLLENYDNAIADYTDAIRLNPSEPRYYNNRGVSHLLKREYDNAVVNYTEAIRLAPDNARYYHNRGGAYNLKKDFTRAVKDFTAAVQLDPENSQYRSDLEKAKSDETPEPGIW